MIFHFINLLGGIITAATAGHFFVKGDTVAAIASGAISFVNLYAFFAVEDDPKMWED